MELLYKIPAPMAIHRIILDQSDRPVDYRFTECNPAFAEMLGFRREEIIGSSVIELLPGVEKDPAGWIEHYGRVAIYGTPSKFEQFSQPLKRWFEVYAFQTEPGSFAVIAEDITSRKQAETAIERQKEEYLSLLSQIREVVYSYELFPKPRFRYISPSVTDLCGYTPDDFYREPELLLQVIHPDDRHLLEQTQDSSAANSPPMRLRCLHRDGSTVWVEHRTLQHHDYEGRPAVIDGIGRDITQRVRMESELEKALENQDAAALVKDQFIANMSHELRTPLNGVIGITELLLNQEPATEQRQLLELIEQSGERLHRIVEKILDFTQTDPAQLRDRSLRFHLPTVCREIFQPIRSRAEKKGIEFTLHYESKLPEWVFGSPGCLQQILRSVADNAVKYTRQGGVAVSVGIEQHNPLRIHCRVADSGLGIAPEYQSRVFEPYFQTEAGLTRAFGGVGLGLALAKRQADAIGATLKLESTPGEGTTVHCSVPLEHTVPPHPEAETGTAQSPAAADSAFNGGSAASAAFIPLRILIAEDNRINQRVTQAIVQDQGHTPVMVTTGRETIEALTREDYDLLLMDIQMPDMDGIETARQIRDPQATVRNPSIPIIAMSAFTTYDEQQKSLKAGMNTFLSKPITPQRLAQQIQNLAALRGTELRDYRGSDDSGASN